ncbi:PilZ domain-containing protein [Aurantimonas sp. MSK8Z-1]|uniref:PilZ domain-containing protein n=1 Tax=Mangrovibrevibacter kandeliae TaxID=2968473 RepID=UPI0021197970|nr:PilZ domain-containing protein [Aurantimonas sp. MSK8Z-1]MCW4114478.1 PilZ domain-containing protein [Aurantimonas sp. MSK8Z-1]
MPSEARRYPRARTRLRPGKLLDLRSGHFLCDCLILDRSLRGARLGFFAPMTLSKPFFLFDEVEGVKQPAQLVWLEGREGGIRFTSFRETVDPEERERVAGRYYAVGG